MSECSTSAHGQADQPAAALAQHEGLVRWVVCRQWRGGLPFEEAVQEGRIALWHALQHYDPARGTTFSTYAVPAIAHAVWRAVALQQRGRAVFCLPREEGAEDALEVMHRREVYAVLGRMVEALPPRLRCIIVAHYGLQGQPPQSFAAIGARLHLTRQRIQQLHVEAVLWLAHPAHSWALRLLLERHQRGHCQRALARQRQVLRQRRGHRPGRRERAQRRGEVGQ